MDFDQLKTFLEVSKQKSFSRAAVKLLVTQPSISAQISSLEKALGVRLLERGGGKVTLTAAGRVFEPFAEDCLTRLNHIGMALADLERSPRGSLLISANDSTALYVLPTFFYNFKKRYPRLALNIVRAERSETLESVLDREADFGVVSLPVTDHRLHLEVIHEDEMLLVLPLEHPLAGLDSVTLKQVAQHALLVPKQGRRREHLDGLFAGSKLTPKIAMELDSNELLKRLVIAGMGMGFLPRINILDELRAGLVHVVAIDGVTIPRCLALISRKDRALTRAGHAFFTVATRKTHPMALATAEEFLGGLMRVFLLALGMLVSTGRAQMAHPDGGTVERGMLPDRWETGGPKCMEMPEWQVHEYNPTVFILRQSGCTDYEKPFVYLIFGKERALLYDTGSRNGNLGPELQRVMHLYLRRNSLKAMPLTAVHSHSHEDHVWGDKGILAINDPAMPVTLVPATVEATAKLYGIAHWPEDTGSIDLGGRVIDVVPIPGHDTVSVALYDRRTALLLTGDSLYPGRIYIRDFDAFAKSNARLVKFTEGKVIAHILGCHIEETRTPFVDYPVGTMYQPNEHELALSRGALLEMEAGIEALHGIPARVAYRDFSLWPVGPQFRMSDRTQTTFDQTQKQQLSHMWDQSAP